MLWVALILVAVSVVGTLACVVVIARVTSGAADDSARPGRFRSRNGIDGPRSAKR